MDQITIPPVIMMMVDVLYQLILFLGDYILLGGFKLEYEVLYLLVFDAKFSGCRSDGDLILDDNYEF